MLLLFPVPAGTCGLSYWLPTIVGVSVSNTVNRFINIIPWVFVGAALNFNPVMAPKHNRQTPYIVGPALFGALCLLLSVYVPGNPLLSSCAARRRACSPPAGAVERTVKLLTGASAAAGMAAINSVGNLGGFIAQNVVPWIPNVTGSTIAPMLFLSASLVVGALMTFLVQGLIRKNRELAIPGVAAVI